MKKTTTISMAALAVSASTSFAIIGPREDTQTKVYCLSMYRDNRGNTSAGHCDQSKNNRLLNIRVGANGCASNQIALATYKEPEDAEYPIKIYSCLPPNVTQL